MNAPVRDANGGGQVTVFQQPRLPYHDAINDRFNVDRAGWKALTEAVFPNARTADSVIMALSYCRARKLDPFKRPVHIVPMWSSATRTMVETIWPGIAELRTTAFRTGQCAGMDAAQFGPTIDREFSGTNGSETRKAKVLFPEWCQITVWRMLNGQKIAFVSPKVYWLEAYGKWKDTQVPNDMWAKRPFGQIEKCTEAAALRRAYPEEIGNDYAAEEMEGQRLIEDHAAAVAKTDDGPPPPSAAKAIENKPQEAVTLDQPRDRSAELVEAGRDNGQQQAGHPADDGLTIPPELRRTRAPATAPDQEAFDEKGWLNDVSGAFSGCETLHDFSEKQREVMAPMKARASAEGWTMAQRMAEDTYHRVKDA